MPSEDINQYQKSDKALFIIYADLECLIQKIDGVKIILKIHFKKEVINKRQQESFENVKICYICKEKFEDIPTKGNKNCKARDHCCWLMKKSIPQNQKSVDYVKRESGT